MSRIKGKDTKPEVLIRRFLHANGFRYKLHDKHVMVNVVTQSALSGSSGPLKLLSTRYLPLLTINLTNNLAPMADVVPRTITNSNCPCIALLFFNVK